MATVSDTSSPRSRGRLASSRLRSIPQQLSGMAPLEHWATPARMGDAMAHRIVILGGGTGGTLVANRLQRLYGDAASITVIDRDDTHVYQPGLLFVPFGLAEPGEIVKPRHAQFRDDIDFRLAEVQSVDSAHNTVHVVDGPDVPYDVLVIATGASLQPEETEGLTG